MNTRVADLKRNGVGAIAQRVRDRSPHRAEHVGAPGQVRGDLSALGNRAVLRLHEHDMHLASAEAAHGSLPFNSMVQRQIEYVDLKGKTLTGPAAINQAKEEIADVVKWYRGKPEIFSPGLVKEIQKKVGVNPDGKIGPITIRAVAAWQRKNSLEDDGKTWKKTLPAMLGWDPWAPKPKIPEAAADTTGTMPSESSPLTALIRLGKQTMSQVMSWVGSVLMPGEGKDHQIKLQKLMEKPRLTADEIGKARQLIELEPDSTKRGDLYENLQSKVAYQNQRDSQAKERKGDARVETPSGGMCNLTSLAMALSYMGISNPGPEAQFEDSLEKMRQEKGYESRQVAKTWTKLASDLGVKSEPIDNPGHAARSKAWYENNIRSRLRAGEAILMSIGAVGSGHIVRIEAVEENGLRVDDPYGKYSLAKGGYKRKIEQYNPSGPNDKSEIAGENVLWPWKDVERQKVKFFVSFGP